jgi:hypothetical protein
MRRRRWLRGGGTRRGGDGEAEKDTEQQPSWAHVTLL